MNVQDTKASIDTYFASEASEMYILIIAAIFLFILAVIFFTQLQGRFSQIFAAGLVLLALIYGGTGVSLLMRDKENHANLTAALAMPADKATITLVMAEQDRIKTVVDGYRNLQFMFAGIAIIGVGLILFWPTQIGMALAALLFVFSASGVFADHYSEHRASIYYQELSKAIH